MTHNLAFWSPTENLPVTQELTAELNQALSRQAVWLTADSQSVLKTLSQDRVSAVSFVAAEMRGEACKTSGARNKA